MPVKNSNLGKTSLLQHKCLSYEALVAAWLMSDGWEVLIPALDIGKKTDLVIADDENYYRIQVKSVESDNESLKVENKWKGALIDYVIYFSRAGNWGYIVPAFTQNTCRLNKPEHIRFCNNQNNFLKAFRKI